MKSLFKIRIVAAVIAICILINLTPFTVSAETVPSPSFDFNFNPYTDTDYDEYNKFLDSMDEEELMDYASNLIKSTPNPSSMKKSFANQKLTVSNSSSFDSVSKKTESELHTEFINSLSDEQRSLLKEKELALKAIDNERTKQSLYKNSSKGTPCYEMALPGTFTLYSQDFSFFCVPASVKTALQYINGESPSQIRIYLSTSTAVANIEAYMELKQDKNLYELKINPDERYMTNCFRYDIVHEVPSFIGIKVDDASDWGDYYTTQANGHCLLVNALLSDYSEIQLADPASKSNNTIPPFYWMSANYVANACEKIVW